MTRNEYFSYAGLIIDGFLKYVLALNEIRVILMNNNRNLPIATEYKKRNMELTNAVGARLTSEGFVCGKSIKNLPGEPNIVIGEYTTAVFIRNCVLYEHKCEYSIWPDSIPVPWRRRMELEAEDNKDLAYQLRKQGWNVITAYECQFTEENFDLAIEKLISILKSLPTRANGTVRYKTVHVELSLK